MTQNHSPDVKIYITIYPAPQKCAHVVSSITVAWLEADACDGFLAVPTHFPTGVEDFTGRVVPELQRRGVFRTEYTETKLREHLGVTLED